MKIAYLASNAPYPVNLGPRYRIAALWKVLRSLGETRLLVFGTPPPLAARQALSAQGATFFPARREDKAAMVWRHIATGLLGGSIPAAQFLSPRRLRRIQAMLAEFAPDLIVLDDTFLGPLVPALRATGASLIVSTHNAESLLCERILAQARRPADQLRFRLLARSARRMERAYMTRADQVWAASEADARHFVEAFGMADVRVVPNVLDMAAYTPDPACEEPGAIVFTGTFTYQPNEDAAQNLLESSRRLAARGVAHRLYLVGRSPSARLLAAARENPHAVVTGEVPDAIAYLAKASVVAAPLTAGSGTKLKVLEAMALARPVLTTPIGAEGLGITSGRQALVAEVGLPFDAHLERLLSAPAERAELGRAGRAWVEAHFDMGALDMAIRRALAGVRNAPS